jgi:hypothetical protein
MKSRAIMLNERRIKEHVDGSCCGVFDGIIQEEMSKSMQ